MTHFLLVDSITSDFLKREFVGVLLQEKENHRWFSFSIFEYKSSWAFQFIKSVLQLKCASLELKKDSTDEQGRHDYLNNGKCFFIEHRPDSI